MKTDLKDNKELPVNEDEFIDWDKKHSSLPNRYIKDCARLLGTFDVEDINYYGNSVVVFKLGKDVIQIDTIQLSMGNGERVYEIDKRTVALVSTDEYVNYDISKERLKVDFNDIKLRLDMLRNLELPEYEDLEYVKSLYNKCRMHKELDNNVIQSLITEIQDKHYGKTAKLCRGEYR